MKKQLTYIGPLRAGIVLAVLSGMCGLVALPIIVLTTVLTRPTGEQAIFGGIFFDLFVPVLYTAVGFIGGIIGAAIYNLAAKWTGGLEFEVRDVLPGA